MKKILKKKRSKIFKRIVIITFILIIIYPCVGKLYYNRTPDGGINETMYVDINGTKQWISIYGQNCENPVLLYLHGGPCSASSYYDWGVLRKLSDVYTVVIWDQRGCGHNYNKNLQFQEVSPLTKEVMMQDGVAMTNYLCDRLHKEKITLFGHSWGSIFAANLVLKNPEKYDKLIVASLVVDVVKSRHYLKDYLLDLDKVKNNEEYLNLVESFDPNDLKDDPFDDNDGQLDRLTPVLEDCCKYTDSRNEKIGDWLLLNPNITYNQSIKLYIRDLINLIKKPEKNIDYTYIYGSDYEEYIKRLGAKRDEMEQDMSIYEECKYEVPFYLLEGTEDRRPDSMYSFACDYYERIEAPDKDYFEFKGGHSSPMIQADTLSDKIHEIARR